MLDYIIARLREPSTAAGVGTVISGFAWLPHAADFAGIAQGFVMVGAGIVAIFLTEKK
ncbi:hypothetical protein UFOVP233_80 [uncultured Caudovirales phage]|uniref:Holin n=1 Tax=uncultured Caudovirales phage TaxID=2100421 RepID=A0A6J7WUT9_9CAUD|nr:hypothetical protein UFOVP233_80 [uncultured Caudovirales phage]